MGDNPEERIETGDFTGPTHGETADSLTEFDESAALILEPTEEIEGIYEASQKLFNTYLDQGRYDVIEGALGENLLYHVEDDGYGYAFDDGPEGGFEVIGIVTPSSYEGPVGSFESTEDYIDHTYDYKDPIVDWHTRERTLKENLASLRSGAQSKSTAKMSAPKLPSESGSDNQ